MNNPHVTMTLPDVSMVDDTDSSGSSNNLANGDGTSKLHVANPTTITDSLTNDEGLEDPLLLNLDPHSPMPSFEQSFEFGLASNSSSRPLSPTTFTSSPSIGSLIQQSTPGLTHPLPSVSSRTPRLLQDEGGDTTASLSSVRGHSLSRRRGGSSGRRKGSSSASTGSIGSTSSTTASAATAASPSDRQRPGSSLATAPAGISVIEEEMNNSGPGLRASLDAGMASVRRWIRLRSGPDPQSATDASMHQTTATINPDPFLCTNPPGRGMSQVETGDPGEEDDLMSFDNNHSEDDGHRTVSFNSLDDLVSSATIPRPPSSGSGSGSNNNIARSSRLAPSAILEEQLRPLQRANVESQSYRSPRQRALSEPDAVTVRDFLFQRALSPQRGFRRRRYTSGTLASINSSGPPNGGVANPGHHRRSGMVYQRISDNNSNNNGVDYTVISADAGRENSPAPSPSQLSSLAVEALFASASDSDVAEMGTIAPSVLEEHASGLGGQSSNSLDNNSIAESDPDQQREARARWININRRFQVVITIVALIFSLLLFAILVCWVVLTSAYVMSLDKSCDVPLKAYFWFVTLQLILDVFRTDIMRLFFRWDSNSNQRIPCRVITYNIAYLTYALLVLRLGIRSVFVDSGSTCKTTAPELFQSSLAFVSLSVAAWATIVLGYLVPFSFVAALLTWNGYTPASDSQRDGATGPFTVFPTAMAAPPGCVDQLRTVRLDDLPADVSKECCICMEDFVANDTIVKTACKHLYHRQCLADWLRHARSCPVCRMDIPSAVEDPSPSEDENSVDEGSNHETVTAHGSQSRLGLVPASRTFGRNTDIHHEVVSLLQIIRRSEMRNRQTSSSGGASSSALRNRSGSIEIRNRSRSGGSSQNDLIGMEEGRNARQY